MNQHIDNLIEKIMDSSKLSDELLKQQTFEDVYNFCIKIEDGYTQDELWEFIEDVLKQNDSLPKKLGDDDMAHISGGANTKLPAKVLAYSLSALTMLTAINLPQVQATDAAKSSPIQVVAQKKEQSFWEKYKKIIIGAGIAAVVALGAFGIYKWTHPKKDEFNENNKLEEDLKANLLKDANNKNLSSEEQAKAYNAYKALSNPSTDKSSEEKYNSWKNKILGATGIGLAALVIADLSKVAKNINTISYAQYTISQIWKSVTDWQNWRITKWFNKKEFDINDAFHNLEVLFGEIKGQEKAKEQIRGIVYDILHERNANELSGKKSMKGNVLYFTGPSGVGKTLMAEGLVTHRILTSNPEPFVISASDIDKDSNRETTLDQLFGLGGYNDYDYYGSYSENGKVAKPKNAIKYIKENPNDGSIIINEWDKIWSPQLEKAIWDFIDYGKIRGIECPGLTITLTSNEKTNEELDDPTKSLTDYVKHEKAFLNRVKIVEFENLSVEAYGEITKKAFDENIIKYWKRPEVANIDVIIDDEIIKKVAEAVYNRYEGARSIFLTYESNLRRDITTKIVEAVTEGFRITKVSVDFDSESEEFILDVTKEALANENK